MPTVKELREQRAPLAQRIKELADKANTEQRDFNADEQDNWAKANADYDALTRQIELAERAEAVAAEQAAAVGEDAAAELGRAQPQAATPASDSAPSPEDRSLALQAWCRVQMGMALDDAHAAAADRCGVNPNARHLDVALRSRAPRSEAELRAQATTPDAAGGHTIPDGFVNSLERAMLAFGGMRRVADIIRTATGNNLAWPTTNDTANKGAQIAENTQVGEQDTTFGAIELGAYKYTSNLVKISAELLQDSAFNLAAELGRILGERLARIQNEHATVGTGTNQPKGILTAAALGVTTADSNAIAPDELLDLIHSIDPAYRPGSTFMLHDNVVLALRKLKDADGRYIWQPGMVTDEPDRIFNYPLVVNQDMPAAFAKDAKTVLFGQLSKFKLREVAGIRLRRLVERYADYDQEGFVAFQRWDSNLLDAGSQPVKYMVQG